MKKRTSSMSRRIVSLLMSLVLTLTLVTPAAFATEVVDGSGTTIVEGDTNPADPAPGEDSENNEDKNTEDEDGKDEQPTNPGDEDKNPDEDNGDDASKPDGDSKDKENPDGDKKDEENKNEQPTEDENNGDDEIALLNAENAADVWAGADAEDGIDTSWYNANETEFKINTAAELAGLAKLVNDGTATFSKKTIKLTADIRLNEQDVPANGNLWTPIGKKSKPFQGTFDGDGHTIRGLCINATTINQGLFGYIDKSAIVQNLIVTGSVTTSKGFTGGIVGRSAPNGTVRNCGFYGTVTATGTRGGVVGSGNALNCWYYRTGEAASNLGVCGKTNGATNCVMISSTEPMTTDKLETLQANAPDTGKVWSWTATETEGTLYPKLIDPPKTITMQPVFPDCKAEVSANGTALTAANGYTYEVTADAVITVSGNSGPLYYAASESEKDYKPGGNLTELESGTTFNGLPKTYYYGTKDDFDTIAVWNSALNGNTATIKDADTLKVLARMVNRGKDSMAGKTIMLGKNIVLDGSDWTSIGTKYNPFKGTFNGRIGITYYTISNLNGDLFGVVKNGTVQYVTIKGGEGRLVGTLESGTVQYCMSTAKVTGSAGGLVGQNSGTVSSCYYYNEDSKNTPAVGGSGTVTNCFYLAETSTFDKKGTAYDIGTRTAEEFKLGRVAYELGGYPYVWVYDTTNKEEKMPQLGSASASLTTPAASELKLTKPDNQPEGVVVTLGSSDKKVLTDVAGNQYYYAASGYSKGVSDVPVTFTAPKGYQIVFTPATTKVDGKDYLRITDSAVEYSYSLIKADIGWYESHKTEKSYAFQNSDELVGLALLVNGMLGVNENFKDWTLSLERDIDLAGVNWIPIGQRNNFAGTFNGNNHAITGLSVVVATGYAGLFGKVHGTVQNLQVEGSVTASGSVTYVGGVVGYNNGGTVQNCLSNVTVNAAEAESKPVGGVVGRNNGTVNLCWNKGNVTGAGFTGGVVGTNSNGTVTNCANFGAVAGGPSYGVGGISGSGAVANSYNMGDVTGAEGSAYGISSGAATNSYYLCKLNGAVEQKYIKDSSSEAQNITATTEDNKTVYKVDGTELVELLNGSKGSYTEWINKQDEPYNPVHIIRWDGSFEEGVEGVITLIYEPNNGGVQTAVTEQQRVEGDTGSFTIKSDTELGFKHENGTFLGWSTDPRAKTADNRYAAGKTVSVEKDKTVTLYAVWENIWTGSGTAADPYQLPDGEKLAALAEQVNEAGFDYAGEWFRLTKDIDLSSFENWTPIGNGPTISDPWFSGNLDGNGKSISGLVINSSNSVVGLFGQAKGGTFKGFKLNGTVTGSGYPGVPYVGSLIGYGSGVTLDSIEADVTVTGGGQTGGLVGYDLYKAEHCTVSGSVTGSSYVGGISTRKSNNNPVIRDCHNSATITGANAAGIWACGTENAIGIFENCTNNGTVSALNCAAGIATAGHIIRGCTNNGNVTSEKNVAAGISNNGNAERCGNAGKIVGYGEPTTLVGGVAGITNFDGSASFCYNIGEVVCTYKKNWAYGITAGGAVSNSFSYVTGKDIALAPNTLAEGKVINSYYLASKKDAVSSAGEYATLADFTSGKVAWGVDGGVNAHKNYWTQGANNYPVPIGEGTSTSYYRAKAECGTGGAVSIKSSRNFTGDADNAVYGPKGMSVTVTATPKDDTFGLKSLTLDLMGTGSTTALESGDSFTLGEANALVVATFASTGNGGSGTGGNGGNGDGSGTDTGDGAGDEDDEGLQDGLNMDVEYNIKGLVLAAYAEWGANGGGKTFAQWLQASPGVLRAFITNSLDNMAAAAKSKDTDEAKGLAALLLASLNEHSGLNSKDGDIIGKALQRYMDTGSEATFSTWLTTGSGMASGTVEEILAQYTDSLLNLTERLYANWESSGTSLTFPQWLDAQQVTMESLSENAEEPDTDTDDTQTSEAPEDVPDGQEAEGGASGGGNSVWEVIGTVVRENPIIVWSIVAVVAALIIVGAVRRYHKVKRDERDDVASKK